MVIPESVCKLLKQPVLKNSMKLSLDLLKYSHGIGVSELVYNPSEGGASAQGLRLPAPKKVTFEC